MTTPHFDNHRRVYGDIATPTERRPKTTGRWRTYRALFLAGVILLLVAFVFGTGLFLWISRDLPDPNKLSDRQVAQSTKIYDRTDTHLLYEVYQNQKRTIVDLDHISPYIIKATVAVEDKYFYEHSGVRITSILRAAFNNLIGRKTGSGGASTLTQQLVKNAIVGDDHSIFRKIKEAILALRLERNYTKDQIIKLYLNEISYGSTNYGVESASQSYFHKSAKDVTIGEAAILAAIPKAPSTYLNNINALRERRDVVLRLMFEQGYITHDEMVREQGIAPRIFRSSGVLSAPHFVLYIKQLLAEKFGEQAVDSDGLHVITTLDFDKQQEAERIVKEQGDKFAAESNANNAALVAMDPKTAQVLALVGSRDYFNDEIDGQFNVAIQGLRQPGSSFKPFVYTAAFERGYTPETVLYDVTTDFDDRDNVKYTPKDYDGKERGLVTIRSALQGSLNIPAVKTLYLVGVKEVINFARRFGYTSLQENAGLSLVLGGSEVNLLEHTDAYATLADNGVYHPPVSILKVTDATGNILYEWTPTIGTVAVAPELAATISNVLSDNPARAYVFGLQNTLTLPDRPVAAKTGTTNDNKDAWTMGYTPSLVTGVWVGNTTPAPMKAGGNKLAGVIWNQFMTSVTKGMVVEQFPSPPIITENLKPVLRGENGGITLPINRLNGKIATSSTPPGVRVEQTFLPPHDILFYVDRTNPRGPTPTHPEDDPQFDSWERGLINWTEKQRGSGVELNFSEPPTEYDDTVSEASDIPVISFLTPTENEIVNTDTFTISVDARAPRGISKVLFQIDNTRLETKTTPPFQINISTNSVGAGEHILHATAFDDVGNKTEAVRTIFTGVTVIPPKISWVDVSPLNLSIVDFPRQFTLHDRGWEQVKTVDIFLSSPTQKRRRIYYFSQNTDHPNTDTPLQFVWKKTPIPDDYTLTIHTISVGGIINEQNLEVKVTSSTSSN